MNPSHSAPESSTLTTRLPSHPHRSERTNTQTFRSNGRGMLLVVTTTVMPSWPSLLVLYDGSHTRTTSFTLCRRNSCTYTQQPVRVHPPPSAHNMTLPACPRLTHSHHVLHVVPPQLLHVHTTTSPCSSSSVGSRHDATRMSTDTQRWVERIQSVSAGCQPDAFHMSRGGMDDG